MGRRGIFDKNIAALKQHETLYQELESEILSFDPDGSIEPNQYHAADPISECHMVFETMNPFDANCILFFGLGLGYALKEFQKKARNPQIGICIIESNPQTFFKALSTFDFTSELSDPRITWICTPSSSRACAYLYNFFSQNTVIDGVLKTIPCPSAVATDQSYYQKILKEVPRIRFQTQRGYGNDVEDTFVGFQHTVDNLDYWMFNPGIDCLKNQFPDQTIISIASGPSLDENWDMLRSLNHKIPMIVCDSAMRKVLSEGVKPDFVTAIERTDLVAAYMKDLPSYDRATLIGPAVLKPETLNNYRGSKVLFRSYYDYETILGLDGLGMMTSGHSAGTLNIVAAFRMGFKNVILVGHNLAFEAGSNRTHFKGIGDDRDQPLSTRSSGIEGKVITVEGQTEGEVMTHDFFDLFRIQIEYIINNNPDRRVINTALTGAKIAGAEALSLKDALAKYHTASLDIHEKKMSLLKPITESEKNTRLQRCLDRVTICLEEIPKIRTELAEVTLTLENKVRSIRANELLGKKISLEDLDAGLDAALALKTRVVDTVFLRYAVLTLFGSHHIQFERKLNAMITNYKDNYLLKRDALIAHHEYYFPIWHEYLPKLEAGYQKVFSQLKTLMSKPSSPTTSAEVKTNLSV